MRFEKKIVEGIFISRPNRFNAKVRLNNEEIIVHVPNTGRCKEILKEGTIVFLREEDNPTRKTKYDLIAAMKGETLINIDSQVPNKVVNEAIINKKIEGLEKYNIVGREKTFGKSRFDFKLLTDNEEEVYYLEVKGVTLEENNSSKFPDAPTERGVKHIYELIEAKKQGLGAGILFLIQLDNVKTFSPNIETDPKFYLALKLAQEAGVDIFAFNCKVYKDEIELKDKVEIII